VQTTFTGENALTTLLSSAVVTVIAAVAAIALDSAWQLTLTGASLATLSLYPVRLGRFV
jgi:hypothetical protein